MASNCSSIQDHPGSKAPSRPVTILSVGGLVALPMAGLANTRPPMPWSSGGAPEPAFRLEGREGGGVGVVHRADLRGPAEGSPGGWTPNMVLDDGGDATDVMLAGKLGWCAVTAMSARARRMS